MTQRNHNSKEAMNASDISKLDKLISTYRTVYQTAITTWEALSYTPKNAKGREALKASADRSHARLEEIAEEIEALSPITENEDGYLMVVNGHGGISQLGY